jgi:hypothetical protein
LSRRCRPGSSLSRRCPASLLSRFCVVVALLLFVVVSCGPDDNEQRIGGCSSFGCDVAPGLCLVGAGRLLWVVVGTRRPLLFTSCGGGDGRSSSLVEGGGGKSWWSS